MPENEVALSIRGLTTTFSNGNGGLLVFDGLDLEIADSEFVCLLGPSGSGKSTLLRTVAALLPPSSGEIRLKGKPADGAPPSVGIVFQDANLMPWRTVLDNILLPLDVKGWDPERALACANEMVGLVGLQGFEDVYPHDLSGGMAQRVAIGRALVHDPDLLLLDEPFGALDALRREQMGMELLRIWEARRKTVLMVTHDISEALLLADRVLVFTERPARVALDVRIDLPRPRLAELRYTAEFTQLARKIHSAIK
ncbi:MAG: ABC transporter ATP-binding protein [Anaerolineae bacterium]|nr:MAG: ABC transporter ATP-binding protein [Anaerolineae bacterium]